MLINQIYQLNVTVLTYFTKSNLKLLPTQINSLLKTKLNYRKQETKQEAGTREEKDCKEKVDSTGG